MTAEVHHRHPRGRACRRGGRGRIVAAVLIRTARLAGLAAITALLAACTAGPDYVRPDVTVPDAWKEAPYKTAEPADALPRGSWWEIFGDPLLDQLESEVIAANPSLRVAEANYRQAQAAIRAARAGLFPTVGGTVAATRSGGRDSGGASSNLSLGAQLSWEIDLWGRVRRSIEASETGAEASAADLENVRLSLQTDLAQSYLALRVADAQRKVLDDTVAAYERSLTLTQNRYNAGVAARAEVVQAQSQLLAAQTQTVDVQAARAQLEHAIAALTGKLPSELSIALVTTLRELPDVPPGMPSILLERRPDVAAAERRVAAANAEVGVATAAIYPDLTLGATAGFAGSALANWLSLPNRFWSLGPVLAATIFDAGLRRAQRDEQIAAYDAAVATYRQTVLTAFREVEDNLSTLRILGEEAAVQQQALAAARESLELTTNQYKAGLVGFLNVVVVQAQAFAAERNAIDLRGRRFNATIALIKALGGGYEKPARTASQTPGAGVTPLR
jgi:NodT family efflux transporter outer membrane factor (OMF) lipoprotein